MRAVPITSRWCLLCRRLVFLWGSDVNNMHVPNRRVLQAVVNKSQQLLSKDARFSDAAVRSAIFAVRKGYPPGPKRFPLHLKHRWLLFNNAKLHRAENLTLPPRKVNSVDIIQVILDCSFDTFTYGTPYPEYNQRKHHHQDNKCNHCFSSSVVICAALTAAFVGRITYGGGISRR